MAGPATAGGSGVPTAVSPVGSAASQGVAADRPSKERAGAIVLDKNRATGKRLARVLASAGYSTKTFDEESPQVLWSAIAESADIHSWLLVADVAAAQTIYTVLGRQDAKKTCRGVLYCGMGSPSVAPPSSASLGGGQAPPNDDIDVAAFCEQAGVLALLNARQARDFDQHLIGIANYLRGQPLLPLQGFLLWGAAAYSTQISNVAGRDAAEARLVKLCSDQLGVSSRVANSIGEVIHELLTNAMYDAPVDAQGRAIYAHDRTAPIQLNNEDRVTFRYGTDGTRLVVETSDRFGRLRRGDFARSLRRAAAGQVNRSAGGAGIGLSMIYRTAQVMQVDVEPGQRTRVTAVFDLDAGRATDGARGARTLIFPDLTIASARRDP
ncbi:MAG TPA: ATP-binding protein [Pseudomonadota bacterium]|nr:ATP-binding protein [Pseudomonadota bacterium]